jgi:hypothetical protein
MVWQDIVITIVNIIFVYALIPQVYKGFKKKKSLITFQTAILTTIGLLGLLISFFSLNLIFSGITSSLTFFSWILLLIQSIIYK